MDNDKERKKERKERYSKVLKRVKHDKTYKIKIKQLLVTTKIQTTK